MTYESYLKLLDGRAATPYAGTTTIAGRSSACPGVSSAPTAASTYNLTATFSVGEQRTVTYPVSDGNPVIIAFTGFVTLSGTVTIPSGTYPGHVHHRAQDSRTAVCRSTTRWCRARIPSAFMLDPSGVVGANANYLYKFYTQGTTDPGYSQTNPFNGGPQNNVLTQIEGDLFAGMNVGFAWQHDDTRQAITINGNAYAAGTQVGSMNSQDWFSLGSALVAQTGTGGVYDYYFGYLQPSTQYYNAYAEALYPLSDAYGFAYSDRIQDGRVSIAWDATQSTRHRHHRHHHPAGQ